MLLSPLPLLVAQERHCKRVGGKVQLWQVILILVQKSTKMKTLTRKIYQDYSFLKQNN
jgi:hypothetical protein